MFSVLLFLFYVSAAIVAESSPYNPPDLILLNCGASSKQSDSDGRPWETDMTKFIPANAADISLASKPDEQGSSVPQVPYTTGVRIFQSNFTYSFPVSAGPKFIRLYFFPSQFNAKGLTFNKTESYFSVTANEHTLLTNFSAYLTAGEYSVVNKEYIVNVDERQMLNITFAPSPSSYAFVNGIEIVSIPTGYYIRGESAGVDDNPIKWVPGNNNYYIDNYTALETLYRLNVGGQTLSATNDTGMYRKWYDDNEYLIGYGYFTPSLDVKIKYTSLTPAYSAPESVYTTSRTLANHSSAVNWTFPLDSGFLYLFRFYYCEFAIEIDGANERVFSVDIANITAESHVDVFLMAGGSKIPIFRDYLVKVPDKDGRRGKQNVWLAIRPNMETRPVWANALLNGLEIFKLNDTQGSLAAANPDFFISQPVQSPPREKKKGGATVGAVVGGVCGGILVIAILGFLIFRQRRRRVANSAGSITKTTWDPLSVVPPSTHNTDGSGAPLPSDLCRSFSLEDLKAATGNFDEKFVVGKGGFGKVYRGFIDNGAIAVAIKRLNPESSQGIRELRGEIAPESLNKYAEIACNCLKEQGIDRPAMSDVVWSLEFALQLQEAAEKRSQAAGVDGFPPGSPLFPLLGNGDSSTTTDNSEGVFSTSDEVAAMSTTSGSGTATTTTGIDRLQSHNVFSLLNHPEGR
nr:receptor-like protein kinase FERONIA [Ipomoea batatas]